MDSKARFSNRVETYVKYRPSYPQAAIDYIYREIGLRPYAKVADIGAGTGICSALLLERNSLVMALEPNREMREEAERALGDHPHFSIRPGSAEETGLPDASVDAIVCAQSFHWFDRQASHAEFRRILRPEGQVVLIWNSRKTAGTPFLEGFDRLIHTFGADYDKVGHKHITRETLGDFFAHGGPSQVSFANRQSLDFEGLRGRLLSSSYSPIPGQAEYTPMMEALQALFDRNQEQGTVQLDYETQLYWGTV